MGRDMRQETNIARRADLQGSSSPSQEVRYRAGWAHRKHIGQVLVSKPSGQPLWTHVNHLLTTD